MIWVMERCKLVVEGAAAAPVAALLHGLVKLPRGLARRGGAVGRQRQSRSVARVCAGTRAKGQEPRAKSQEPRAKVQRRIVPTRSEPDEPSHVVPRPGACAWPWRRQRRNQSSFRAVDALTVECAALAQRAPSSFRGSRIDRIAPGTTAGLTFTHDLVASRCSRASSTPTSTSTRISVRTVARRTRARRRRSACSTRRERVRHAHGRLHHGAEHRVAVGPRSAPPSRAAIFRAAPAHVDGSLNDTSTVRPTRSASGCGAASRAAPI